MPNCFKIWSKRFERVEMQDDFAFFMVGGFDFGVDTQAPVSKSFRRPMSAAAVFGLDVYVLKYGLAAAFDFAQLTSRF